MKTEFRKSNEPEIERRALRGIEMRAAPEGSKSIGTLVGYAAVFNSDSEEMGYGSFKMIERVAAGAFKRTLQENKDVVALWAHDTSLPLARMPKSLRAFEDDKGLGVEIDLPDTSTARDVKANIEAGVVDSMSFGFRVKAEKWEEREGYDLRTLLDVDLIEVSPVTFPAYPDTSIAVRSREAAKLGSGVSGLGSGAEGAAGDAGAANETPPTEGRESASEALVNDAILEPEWRHWEILFGIR
jgi:HK97 family phage prohead protease